MFAVWALRVRPLKTAEPATSTSAPAAGDNRSGIRSDAAVDLDVDRTVADHRARGLQPFSGPKAEADRSLASLANGPKWRGSPEQCRREALDPNGLGAIMYQAADAGDVTEDEAGMLVRSFLSAGVDTTVRALGGALLCFAESPEQWQTLREKPQLSRNAAEEAIRHASPFQTVFRTTTREVELDGVRLGADEKILLSLGAANHDPAKWDDPEKFDVERKTVGHVGFGAGIHGCAGQMLARLEIEVLLSELARRVKRIERIGDCDYALNNTTRGLSRLPVRMTPA